MSSVTEEKQEVVVEVEKVAKENSIMSFLKGLTPATIVVLVVIIVGALISGAVYKSDTNNSIKFNTIQITAQKEKVDKIEVKVESNEKGVVENDHRSDLLQQNQNRMLNMLEQIQHNIDRIPKTPLP